MLTKSDRRAVTHVFASLRFELSRHVQIEETSDVPSSFAEMTRGECRHFIEKQQSTTKKKVWRRILSIDENVCHVSGQICEDLLPKVPGPIHITHTHTDSEQRRKQTGGLVFFLSFRSTTFLAVVDGEDEGET